MRTDGADAHRLTSAGSDDVGPTYSPDGNFIAFTPQRADDHALRWIRQPARRRARHASSLDRRAKRSRKMTHRSAALSLCARRAVVSDCLRQTSARNDQRASGDELQPRVPPTDAVAPEASGWLSSFRVEEPID